jgi:hypothetical protein
MNSPAAELRRVRQVEVAAVEAGETEFVDLKAFKASLLAKVITKTIVKEVHPEPIR